MRIFLIGADATLDGAFLAAARAAGHEVTLDTRFESFQGRHHALARAGHSSGWLSGPAGEAPPVADVVVLLTPIASTVTTLAHSEAVDRLVERCQESSTRVVVLSSSRVETPVAPPLATLWEKYAVEKWLRNPLLDLARMEQALRRSGLRWSIVRAMPARREGRATARLSRGERLVRPRSLTPAALAAQVLKVVEDDSCVGSVVEVG